MNSFEKELIKRLDQLKWSKTDVLTQTVLTQDEYMRQMGYLQCIRDIFVMCDNINQDIIKS
jgi:hypothetical protein